MKLGIISDSHDHLDHLRQVLERLREEKVEAVLHCGDLCAPFVLHELESLERPVHVVFGNVDGDRHLLMTIADAELEHVRLHGEVAEVGLGGWTVGVNHFPVFAEGLAATGRFDLVAYGHTHEQNLRRVGSCILVNPGEIMGRKGKVGYALADTSSGDVSLRKL